jgi:glycosyltransferase involved in cell wall biosynthesis
MRILLVAQYYHPCVGGVETLGRQVAHGLAQSHGVRVVAANFAANRLPSRFGLLHTNLLVPSYPSFEDGSVPVHALTPDGWDRFRMAPIALRVVPRLQRYAYHSLNRFGYQWYRRVFQPRLLEMMREADVVHSLAGGYLGWTAQAAAAQARVPFVCTPFAHPGQWGDDAPSVAYYQRAAAVIALTKGDRAFLASLGVPEENLHVVGVSPDLPPSSNPARFRARHGLGNKPFVLFVGRMMPQKGAQALLAAAPRVWQQLPETRFVFIGPPTTASTHWFTDADARILALGPVDAQEKADALAACDLFCMPSTSEILPTVYLEAWSYGKPVVAGTAPGLSELVEDNGGGVTVAQDPSAIGRALIELLSSPDLRTRLGQRGKALVESRYSEDAVMRALETLYHRLMAEHRALAAA